MPEHTKNLRFDPANFPIKAKITASVKYKDKGDEQNIDIQSTNGSLDTEGYTVFGHDDPIYYLDCTSIDFTLVDYVCFKGEAVRLGG